MSEQNSTIAMRLASWAHALEPTGADLALADRSLLDTVAVALSAATHPVRRIIDVLAANYTAPSSEAASWAALAHLNDFDDLHMESTTHISTVCVPVALACADGDGVRARRAYLAGAGVMARLGMALGWTHYTSGWHATVTGGAPAAAVTAAIAMGLDEERTATALALAIPSAGGVQRAFGTDAKSLQVGGAAAAGVSAARLAQAGASADLRVVEPWLALVGGDADHELVRDPASASEAVPGGLAIKMFPACYALQRPIAAVQEALAATRLDPQEVVSISISTPRGTVQPLIHHEPTTGLAGKFSLEYAAATAVLDGHCSFGAFEDKGVMRPEAQRLLRVTSIALADSGADGLLDGEVSVRIATAGGEELASTLALPPGAPGRPPTAEQMRLKLADSLRQGRIPDLPADNVTWGEAAGLLRTYLAPRSSEETS